MANTLTLFIYNKCDIPGHSISQYKWSVKVLGD